MLSHSPSATTGAYPHSIRAQQHEHAWAAIESTLRKQGVASTREIADAAGLSACSAQARLRELRELGEVRFAASRKSTSARMWMLGAEEFVERAEQMKPTLIKAVQLGIFQRDPLVAALFGGGQARCVSCAQPQGAPHAEGCVFVGLNIDAIHQRVAS